MKSNQNREVLFTLELNEKEAGWLNSLVQNPLFDNETEVDYKMRELFFDATKIKAPSALTYPDNVRNI